MKTMGKIGWGIIGYGVVGSLHAKATTQAPDAELIAVCDVHPNSEATLRKDGYTVPFYSSHTEMFRKEPRIQAVSICTPSGLHYQSVIAAARAGRHVLCEKPLDISLSHIDRIIDACDQAGVKLGCVFQRRTDPECILTKKALDRSLLGKLVLGDSVQKYYRSPAYYRSAGWRGTWKLDGGGALMNQAVHGIDLLLWLMGDAVSVFSYSDHIVRDIEVEDTSVSVVRFKNGAIGTITGATSVVPGQSSKTHIHGEKGSIILGADPVKCWTSRTIKGIHKVREVDLTKTLKSRGASRKTDASASDNTALSIDGHTIQVQDLCTAIRRDRDPMVPGIEARRSVELVLAIYRSWKTRREIHLPLR